MEQEVKIIEEKKGVIDTIFKDISVLEAFNIAKNARASELKVDEYLNENGYEFTYSQLSSYLVKNGYKVDWYLDKDTVEIDRAIVVDTDTPIKLTKETYDKLNALNIDFSEDAKDIFIETIISKALTDIENGTLSVVREKTWQEEVDKSIIERNNKINELKDQLKSSITDCNYKEISRIALELDSLV